MMRRTTHIAAILPIFITALLVGLVNVYLGWWAAEVAAAYVGGAVFGAFIFWWSGEAAE